MADKCLLRVEKLLNKSSIGFVEKDEILNQIKIAQAELKLSNIDEINVDKVAKDVQAQIVLQRKINKRNAIEDEIKGRELVDYVLDEFQNNPQEGLTAILVGSTDQKKGARASAAVQQHAAVNQLINGFPKQIRDAGVEKLFADADRNTQLRIARTWFELAQQPTKAEAAAGVKPTVTEKNPDIVKIATIMHEYSEMVRQQLNDRGANIPKLWGYVVRQSHDPYLVRDAAKVLGKQDVPMDPKLANKYDQNYNKNFAAWKDFVMDKLDKDRTFANTDNIDEFMLFAYNSLVRNESLKSNGAEFTFGARPTKNVAKSAEMKRVLHFKDADSWFEYNEMFGVGNLNESFFSGLTTAGRNIGIMDTLGTKPGQNFEKIRKAVATRMAQEGKDAGKVSSGQYKKYMDVIDGTIYSVEGFALARWSAIARTVASTAKLGGAVISALSDLAQYGAEMRYQGRGFLSGMSEALGSLFRLKSSKDKKEIAEALGFMADNTIYDISGRFQVGDNLSKGWTNVQRTFFKYNLLSWWTNTLKEGAMLSMANYFAKQKNIQFEQLNPSLKNLFNQYNIDAVRWDVIRSVAMEKSADGKEFISIRNLDNITDKQALRIAGLKQASEREIRIIKEKFKSSVSGMLLDRSTYAVIEPDAKIKAKMTQGLLAGTYMGEAIRFIGQFKAFPMSIVYKTLSREASFWRAGNKARAISGIASILVTSILLGYVSMTAKDLLKGRGARNPLNRKTLTAAFLQGGGLGIYGDVLFQETRSGADIAASMLGPVPLSTFDVLQGIKYGMSGEGDKAARQAYRVISTNIPFLNLFYTKTVFDYLIGYQMMETMSPGVLKRIEKRMEKDYNQEFLLTKPSQQFTGF